MKRIETIPMILLVGTMGMGFAISAGADSRECSIDTFLYRATRPAYEPTVGEIYVLPKIGTAGRRSLKLKYLGTTDSKERYKFIDMATAEQFTIPAKDVFWNAGPAKPPQISLTYSRTEDINKAFNAGNIPVVDKSAQIMNRLEKALRTHRVSEKASERKLISDKLNDVYLSLTHYRNNALHAEGFKTKPLSVTDADLERRITDHLDNGGTAWADLDVQLATVSHGELLPLQQYLTPDTRSVAKKLDESGTRPHQVLLLRHYEGVTASSGTMLVIDRITGESRIWALRDIVLALRNSVSPNRGVTLVEANQSR